jgi:hypothetical protein
LPDLVPVEGTLLLGGQPLPNAQITFTPTASGLPGDATATAVTDDTGHFKLTTGGKPGAVPGEHVVTVIEGPTPEDLRGDDAQDKAAKFQKGLKNRPIPAKYASAAKSDVKVTVAKDKGDYKVELTR